MRYISVLGIFSLLFIVGCESPQGQIAYDLSAKSVAALALDGTPLYPYEEPAAVQQKKDSLLEVAYQNYQENPDDLIDIIWYGRRLGYRMRLKEAIAVYTKGIEQFPDAPELYRHRGHCYLSMRKFDMAITDLKKAGDLVKDLPLEAEQDELPNKLNEPLSTLQFNIWYHWALGYYFKGNYERAAKLYETCLEEYCTNDDLIVATSDWLYMTYQKLGETEKAKQLLEGITEDMTIVENGAYHKRLLLYKGVVTLGFLMQSDPDEADNTLDLVTQGYGMGNWYASNGELEKAEAMFKSILETNYWSAFGYIAAEVELNRYAKIVENDAE